MNILAIASFALAAAVFGWAAYTSTDTPGIFLNMHGVVIVLGGSLAATSISFQLDRALMMVKVFWNRTILGKKPDYIGIIKDLMKLAEAYRSESNDIQSLVENQKDPFIKESMLLLMDDIVEPAQLSRILRARTDTMYERYNDDAHRFRAMGKYPPAMGLMGAVLGMIALLGGLGKPGSEKTIGPALSIALVATLYGIAFANLVVIPIGENLTETAKEHHRQNTIIIEGIKLVASKTNPIVLAEELNSYLLPSERVDWKKFAI
ncbi:MAG: MotA/TolQ/ExbB proton channel family protein [Proteobacteria bacterium]|nr:MotA/TolQ/ExbB proton channel family protein [Pseudomonadota bacterium]